jgi:hypothetical protein
MVRTLPLRAPRHRLLAAALAVGLLAATFAVAQGGQRDRAAAAAAVAGDGTTPATAGVSCWGIKRQHPASASGTYWLLTPAMARPASFYCDMVTDGGGWVLIARGRDGWVWSPAGQGSAATVRGAVSGPAAFVPASLSAATIDGLINRSAPSALSEGIRVERAANASGSSFQQLRLYPTWSTWNWSWDAGLLLKRIVVGSTSFTGSNTRDTYDAKAAGMTTNGAAGKQGTTRMFTWPWVNNGNKAGFSYGKGGPTGSTSSTTNLWQHRSTGYTLPFTRVWLRPKLANTATFAPIPAAGYGPSARAPGLSDRSERAPWGVVGNDHTGEASTEPWNTNVLAVEATPSRVFVGGRFTGVQRGPGATPVAQRSLAAFDLDGNFISTFRPQIAGRVWDVLLTPDGKLIIAGDFTSVNGVANTRGLAALDPTTGAVVSGWKARISRVGGTEWRVRTLDQRDGWIYAGGTFDRLVAGTATVPVAVTNAIAVSASNGTQGPWKPTPNGSVVDLTVTADGTRVLLAGYFSSVGGSTRHGHFAVTSRSTGAPTSGVATWTPSVGTGSSPTQRYQLAVADLGERMVIGGSEHSTQLWNKARTTMLDAAITKPGGDTQVIEVVGSKTYVGCHCGGWMYQGTNNYTMPPSYRSVDAINLVGAWDTATWTYDTTWFPGSLKGASGEGIWAIDADARGCLWVGGDLDRGAYSGDAATDWLGGFARFCPADATAPSAPGSLRITSSGIARTLSWTGASDPGGAAVTYDIVRNGRVIATASSATRSFTDPAGAAGSSYTVRAVDPTGNRSASPAPVTVS